MVKKIFSPDKVVMLANAIKLNGNISALAEHYKVSRETLYQYFKRDPKGKEIIDQVRGVNEETILDAAEHVLRYNLLNYKSNAGLAQRAAEKVIDRKGHLRGWVALPNETKVEESVESNFNALMEMIQERQSASNISDINMSAEHKSKCVTEVDLA